MRLSSKLHALLCFVAVIWPTHNGLQRESNISPNQLQDGSTAVMYACQLNHLSIADRLIEVGADLELPLTVSYVNEHGYIVASYLLTMNVFLY